MAFKYLSKEVLAGFDKYKYNAVDTSPISKYISHPFWNWCVEFYPMWIAPNVLTLAGFLCLVVQYVVLTYYDASFYASADAMPAYTPIPNYVWLLSSICIFLAHTLDGTDGKQARRTKTSGPLGEMFDHGLDSWSTLFFTIGIFSLFGCMDYSVNTTHFFLLMMAVQMTFLVSHWEKYNTGVLYLPWGYDISQLGLTAAYLVASIQGYQMVKFMVPGLGITFATLGEIGMYASLFVASLPVSLVNIYVSYRDNTGKCRSFYEAMRPLIGPLVLYSLFFIWAKVSPYDILKKEPRLLLTACGTVFSNIACRLIVNGMSNTRCEVFNFMLVPLVAIVIGVMTLHLGVIELYLLWAYTLFILAAHIHYGICVVHQLADHLNINIFSTEKKPPRPHSE